AFAQFGSDLDPKTQAILERGKRVVEVFKQPQFDPVSVEIQAAALWAVQNNFFDDVPVEKLKDFQAKLTYFLQTRKTDLLAKISKAQQAVLSGRPYATVMNSVLGSVTRYGGDFRHPLLEAREVKKRCVIIVGTDKGLCGALNSNLFREAGKFDKATTVYITAG